MKNIGLVPELNVSNFAKSLTFYTEVLGFETLYARDEEKFAYLKKGNAELMLEESSHPVRAWITGDLTHPRGRGINFQVEVDDVDGLHAKIVSLGLPLFFEMEEKWYRKDTYEVGNRQFLVQDPDGYLFRFYKDLGQRPL